MTYILQKQMCRCKSERHILKEYPISVHVLVDRTKVINLLPGKRYGQRT